MRIFKALDACAYWSEAAEMGLRLLTRSDGTQRSRAADEGFGRREHIRTDNAKFTITDEGCRRLVT